MKKTLVVSVHDVVDLLLRGGDIDDRIFNQSSIQEGSRIHLSYQRKQDSSFISEYPLSISFSYDDFDIKVSGKADGITKGSSFYKIVEIKSTVDDIASFHKKNENWHLGQALFYAYIFSLTNALEEIDIQLLYISQKDEKIQSSFYYHYSYDELSSFVKDLMNRYHSFIAKIMMKKEERDISIQDIAFPFSELRAGQHEMMAKVDESFISKSKAYIQAPTGMGKTVAVLYPLIKQMRSDSLDKILYLTSKNSIKQIAMNTIETFTKQGGKIKALEITSKENICFNKEKGHCNSSECPFAKGYYDKLFESINEILDEDKPYTREYIEDRCIKKEMCPYSFEMDIASYMDILVLDYKYVFDINDPLQLLTNREHISLAIDECHNLPDRVKDMYSIKLYPEEIEHIIASSKGKTYTTLRNHLKKILIEIEEINNSTDEKSNNIAIPSISEKLYSLIEKSSDDIKKIAKKEPEKVKDELLEFMFNLDDFNQLYDFSCTYEEKSPFIIYISRDENQKAVSLSIINIDPSSIIKEKTSSYDCSIFFSATLLPKDYYIDLLGGDETDIEDALILPSPFLKENRRIYINTNLSLRYQDRDRTLFDVYCYIKSAISMKKGNYFIFCPSFYYLEALNSFFSQEDLDIDIFVQKKAMGESEKKNFLENFKYNNEKTTIALVVIGGIFSEGIDLVGDRLIGAIVISAGLPQICFERDVIKNYYEDKREGNGFLYAYTYPGINRILQAGGRVIRTSNDRGFILYIDSRFKNPLYRDIIRELYPDAINLISTSQLRASLKRFYQEEKEKDEL